jgi:hypothetical protein
LGEKHAQRIMGALDIGDDPAVRSIHDNKIQRDRAAIVVKADRDIGLVVLLAKDRDRDGAELPRQTLDQKIVRLAF